jgi:hypothetical protein
MTSLVLCCGPGAVEATGWTEFQVEMSDPKIDGPKFRELKSEAIPT